MQKTYYLETYGCQMNVADSELVESILKREDIVQHRICMQPMLFLSIHAQSGNMQRKSPFPAGNIPQGEKGPAGSYH